MATVQPFVKDHGGAVATGESPHVHKVDPRIDAGQLSVQWSQNDEHKVLVTNNNAIDTYGMGNETNLYVGSPSNPVLVGWDGTSTAVTVPDGVPDDAQWFVKVTINGEKSSQTEWARISGTRHKLPVMPTPDPSTPGPAPSPSPTGTTDPAQPSAAFARMAHTHMIHILMPFTNTQGA